MWYESLDMPFSVFIGFYSGGAGAGGVVAAVIIAIFRRLVRRPVWGYLAVLILTLVCESALIDWVMHNAFSVSVRDLPPPPQFRLKVAFVLGALHVGYAIGLVGIVGQLIRATARKKGG